MSSADIRKFKKNKMVSNDSKMSYSAKLYQEELGDTSFPENNCPKKDVKV